MPDAAGRLEATPRGRNRRELTKLAEFEINVAAEKSGRAARAQAPLGRLRGGGAHVAWVISAPKSTICAE